MNVSISNVLMDLQNQQHFSVEVNWITPSKITKSLSEADKSQGNEIIGFHE